MRGSQIQYSGRGSCVTHPGILLQFCSYRNVALEDAAEIFSAGIPEGAFTSES